MVVKTFEEICSLPFPSQDLTLLPPGPSRDSVIIHLCQDIAPLQLNVYDIDLGFGIPEGIITALLRMVAPASASITPSLSSAQQMQQLQLLSAAAVMLHQPRVAQEAVDQGGIERLMSVVEVSPLHGTSEVLSHAAALNARAAECLAALCHRNSAVIQDMKPTKLRALQEVLTKQLRTLNSSQHPDVRAM